MAQIRLNKRTGGQLMLRGRVTLGGNSAQPIEEQPILRWTLQLPGSYK